MIKENLYTYIGQNGTVTSAVFIEGAPVIKKLRLRASAGKMLTNGSTTCKETVIPEADLYKWSEITE